MIARRRAPLVSLDDVADRADALDVAADHEDSDRRAAVRRALHALPARYRDVLVLFYFHELDVERAAASLGVPVGTVKARLSRGREILRRKLVSTPPAETQRAPVAVERMVAITAKIGDFVASWDARRATIWMVVLALTVVPVLAPLALIPDERKA